MDTYKFGGFILLIGLALFAYGLIVILSNLDKQFDRSQSQVDPIFGRMDLQNALNVNMENERRAQRRSEAIPYLIAGGIVGILGFGMRKSAKRQVPSMVIMNQRNITDVKEDIAYCNTCYQPIETGAKFCAHCGAKLE